MVPTIWLTIVLLSSGHVNAGVVGSAGAALLEVADAVELSADNAGGELDTGAGELETPGVTVVVLGAAVRTVEIVVVPT